MPKQKTRRREDQQAEQKTRDSLEFLSSVVDAVVDPFTVIGTDFRVKLMNQAARVFYHTPDELPDNPYCYKLIFGSDQPCAQTGQQCPLIEVLETDRPVRVKYEQKKKSGASRYFEILGSPLYDSKGSLLGIVESLRDITKQTEYARMLEKGREKLDILVLQRSAEFLEAKEQAELLCRVIPSAIFTVKTDRTITSWNKKAEDVTGYQAAEVLGKSCDIFALEPCTTGCGVFSKEILKPIMGRECRIRTKNGQVRTVSKNADLLRNSNGGVVGAVESFEDITDRKIVEELLRAERYKFMSMLTALNQGMHILNRDYIIEYQNDILQEDFGDQVGRKCYEVYKQLDAPCEICRMKEAIKQNRLHRTELLMTNGRYYEQSYAPFKDVDGQTKALILLRDITEEKTHQAETMRAAQLASIGELAAGVAHEINNPINGIINYAQILLDESGQQGPTGEILPMLIKEGERIANIVRNLLSFARQDSKMIDNISLAQVQEEALALINHQLTIDGITVEQNIPEDLPMVKANPQQVQQVFLNILSNARHALNQRFTVKDPQKKIKITGLTVELAGKLYVRLSFTDYGTGIPQQIIGKIFDPFFSSKKPGEGTGLGLSISHGLINDYNGFLRVESQVNTFTTMTVDLPAVDPEVVE